MALYIYTPHEKFMPELTTMLIILRKYVINNLSNMIKLILNKRILYQNYAFTEPKQTFLDN